MDTLTVEQGNALIAEFDGWVQDVNIKDKPYWHPERNMTKYTYPQGFKYHTSWDWLMPVVEKIEAITAYDGRGEVNYVVTIEPESCIISQGGEGELVFQQSESKIEAVWLAVVEFIQWYNTQKQKK